jgi:hypothetical protein
MYFVADTFSLAELAALQGAVSAASAALAGGLRL